MITQKLKICSVCNKPTKLWKSKPELCFNCARKQAAAEAIERSKGEHNHKGLTASVDGNPAKAFKYQTTEIKKVSTRQQKLNTEYAKKRKEFLKNNRFCEAKWLNCSYLATTVHHSAGRLNGNLTNEKTFKALCFSCHTQVEIQVERAKKEGLTIDRLCKN